MNISIPIAILIIILLTPQFMCWETCKAEFTSVFRKPLPLIITMISNWLISPLIGVLAANIFLSESLFSKIGVSLLFIGPSISMVLYWSKLAGGSKNLVIGATLLNMILIITLYPFLAYILIRGMGAPIPLESIFFTILIFFLTPLILGLILQYIFKHRQGNQLSGRVYKIADRISLIAFFTLLIVLYIIQSRNIISHPLEFIIISIPVLFGYFLVFVIILVLNIIIGVRYEDMVSVVIIGTGNQYELAVAASTMIFGVHSTVTFAVSVGPLLEAPIMILIINILLKIYNLNSGKHDFNSSTSIVNSTSDGCGGCLAWTNYLTVGLNLLRQ